MGFETGDRVKVVKTDSEFIGVVKDTFDSIYIVKPDGCNTLIKCLESELTIVNKESEGIEKKTITEEEFNEAVSKILDSNFFTRRGLKLQTVTILLASGNVICDFLRKELFEVKKR